MVNIFTIYKIKKPSAMSYVLFKIYVMIVHNFHVTIINICMLLYYEIITIGTQSIKYKLMEFFHWPKIFTHQEKKLFYQILIIINIYIEVTLHYITLYNTTLFNWLFFLWVLWVMKLIWFLTTPSLTFPNYELNFIPHNYNLI